MLNCVDLQNQIYEIQNQEIAQCYDEIEHLKRIIYETFDGLQCPKCGAYHKRYFICPNCGYDRTAPEE